MAVANYNLHISGADHKKIKENDVRTEVIITHRHFNVSNGLYVPQIN